MKEFVAALKMFIWMVAVTGIAYPLLVTGIAQLTMADRANGGLLSVGDKLVGAELIGQKFTAEKYFWGRPSAGDYNPLPSGGSNLGPTSKALKETVGNRRDALVMAHHLSGNAAVPSELLYASGSGLDPHISPVAALFQVDRISEARGVSKEELSNVVKGHVRSSWTGNPTVNVLELNLSLESMGKRLADEK